MFETVTAAQAWIESIQKFGEKYDLTRMRTACAMLNHPERSFKSIHIGGTNGKGSTLQYLNRILIAAGYRVGTFTSPYIVRFNERITLDNVDISNEDLLMHINTVYQLQKRYLEEHGDQITFFELITLVSFLYFREKAPDIVLYEVGLGGTLDATNVIEPMISIITSIGYDHMTVLGGTLESIAANKLGIVKRRTPLITGVTQASLFEQFEKKALEKEAPLHFGKDYPLDETDYGFPTSFVYKQNKYTLSMHGPHQVENARLALIACEVLRNTYHLDVPQKAIREGLEKAFMPGRFEQIGDAILDGAHNINGLQASLETLKAYYPDKRHVVLFSVMADKDYMPMLKLLENAVDAVIFTEIPYVRSEKAETLHSLCGHPHKSFASDFTDALEKARAIQKDDTLLITGSLYFISQVRAHIIKERFH